MDMKGVDPKVYQHIIDMKEDNVPIHQQRYRMDSNYENKVK